MRELFAPKAYQPVIASHIMHNSKCAVWVPMGMGKSVATLTALDNLHFLGDIDHPVLIIAPLRVAQTTWPEEAAKWQHLDNIVMHTILGTASRRTETLRKYLPGAKKHGKFSTADSRLQIFTTNYENIPWLVEHLGGKWPFKTIVADESTKLKGYRSRQGTQRARALAKVMPFVSRFVELTGTPSPNGLADLWGQVWFLDGGERLGRSFTAFSQRWFQRSFDGFSITPLPMAQKEIETKLKGLCLSLNAADYFDLQAPITNTIYVDLPPKAREQYKEMEKKMFMELEEAEQTHEVEAFNAASRTIKCLQIANGAAYVGEGNEKWVEIHDAKIEALRDVVEEAAGMPVLVAYHFKSDLARLRAAFPKGRVLDKSPQTIRDWNTGKLPILFAHPASAGHGINLQHGGNILVVFGHWWNLEEYQQVIERIGPVRQLQSGFKRPVFIHHIVARGTVDELVMARRESKREVQDLLLHAMKNSV